MPLVLMSEGGSANEVWKSIELGAVEYLEKPLSPLKLRNIWQHVVRKVIHNMPCQKHHLGNNFSRQEQPTSAQSSATVAMSFCR